MGQRLAEAAVRGINPQTMQDEAQELLDRGDITGLLALRRSQFGGLTMMAREGDDDEDDDGDEDDDDADEDEDDDADEDDDEDDADKGKKVDAKTRRIRELSSENKRYRQKASERGKRLKELEAEIAELKKGKSKPKGKDGDEDDEPEADEETEKLRAQNTELQNRLVRQQLRMEFTDLVTGPKAVARFKNPKAAFRLLDLDDVEIDDDGEIDGLAEAIKDLAKSEPYLLDQGGDDDDEDEDELEKRRARRRSGQPTGSGARKKGGNANREKLLKKYPALRR